MSQVNVQKILFTGGGTAGHVMPILSLIPFLQEEDGLELHYVGMANSIEEKLILEQGNIPFHAIRGGKLRRYFSWENFKDFFRVLRGYFDARKLLKTLRPDLVFSKGGFVTVPVVYAAKHLSIPVVLHESDYSPGLANRLGTKAAQKVLVTFEDTLRHTGEKGIWTGTPLRPAIYKGDRQRGLDFLGFDGSRPVLLAMGGSQGAQALNEGLHAVLPQITERFDLVQLCGQGKLIQCDDKRCRQYEYIDKELPDLLAAADLALGRAGANTVFELTALGIPALYVPLPLSASRGDQIQNADYVQKRGYAAVLPQEELEKDPHVLVNALYALHDNIGQYRSALASAPNIDGTQAVLAEIRKTLARQ